MSSANNYQAQFRIIFFYMDMLLLQTFFHVDIFRLIKFSMDILLLWAFCHMDSLHIYLHLCFPLDSIYLLSVPSSVFAFARFQHDNSDRDYSDHFQQTMVAWDHSIHIRTVSSQRLFSALPNQFLNWFMGRFGTFNFCQDRPERNQLYQR